MQLALLFMWASPRSAPRMRVHLMRWTSPPATPTGTPCGGKETGELEIVQGTRNYPLGTAEASNFSWIRFDICIHRTIVARHCDLSATLTCFFAVLRDVNTTMTAMGEAE